MSEHDSREHNSFIKTPQQLLVVVVLSFVVPILLIALLASLAFRSFDPGGAGTSDEAIAKRLKPVGEVVVADGTVPPEAQAATPSAPPAAVAAVSTTGAAAPAAAGKGKAVYDSACAVCHAAGVAGAPKMGDKAAWAVRLKQGMDALHAAALKGKGAMPPKGGNMALSDADVKAAVEFMASQAK